MQRNRGALCGLAELEGYFRFDVGPRDGRAVASTTAAVENATEDIPKTAALRRSSRRSSSEDVGEVEFFRRSLAHVRRSKPAGKVYASHPSKPTAAADHGLKLVVFLTRRDVGKHVIGFGNTLKFLCCRRVIGVSVRVILTR